jgi:hypothetical protein
MQRMSPGGHSDEFARRFFRAGEGPRRASTKHRKMRTQTTVCPRCKVNPRATNAHSRKLGYCVECKAAYGREYRQRHPWPEAESTRRRRLGLCHRCGTQPRAHAALCGPCSTSWRTAAERKKRQSRTAYIQSRKAAPCRDCGGCFPPEAMQFDHLPQFPKLFKLSGSWGYSRDAVDAEIAKCELVCANCHAIRTAARARRTA